MLNKSIVLPASHCGTLDLPTQVVTREHFKTLWKWQQIIKKN